ncbi:MAG TPA: hypothetical protein VN207_01720 [Ktedonobacteraceae bacterium]|nr:hypothetical protein [Ktedonobacteraceae bacterium]
MSVSPYNTSLSKDQHSYPVVHLSYECVLKERLRESPYLYEIACSINYPVESGYLSIRITGQNTYRNLAARDVPFIRHEAGATTYVELLEGEQLEVRVIEHEGTYCKAFYSAHRQELIEQSTRQVVSSIQRITSNSDTGQNGKSE